MLHWLISLLPLFLNTIVTIADWYSQYQQQRDCWLMRRRWISCLIYNAVEDDINGDKGVYIAFSWIGFADAHLQLQQNLIESAFCNSMIRSNIFLSVVRRRKNKAFLLSSKPIVHQIFLLWNLSKCKKAVCWKAVSNASVSNENHSLLSLKDNALNLN